MSAQKQFAELGFEASSLRLITKNAGVNLAAVNYHFGSKKMLIQSVMDRSIRQFAPYLKEKLEQLILKENVKTADIVEVFIDALKQLDEQSDEQSMVFIKLIGRSYAESQGHLKRYFVENYPEALDALLRLMRQLMPSLDDEAIFWRLHCALGSLVFLSTSADALIEMAEAEFNSHVNKQHILDVMPGFLESALTANNNER
nr:TetR family transcriptional regulator [Marinifaba aquimaris]